MKLKEIERNGNIAFSPKNLDSTYVVVGTAAQQLDASFNTSALLELYEFIPSQSVLELQKISAVSAPSRFTKILWSSSQNSEGNIICADDSGSITVFNAHNAINNDLSKPICRKNHSGAVLSMDVNKFKSNLLATGGADSDFFIWDIEKLDDPMSPGQKSQPFEDVVSIAWNHKVESILGSVSPHRCQIWDLRKTEPVIKLSDTQTKMKPNKILWHPEISTRLCLSSGDDHSPVIQMWDLRYTQCPYHTLERHMKGVVDMDWSLDDPELLVSVGRDDCLLGFNVATHETAVVANRITDVVYERQLDQQLLHEVKFCPKHPAVVAVSSFDCHVSLYSLMGGRCTISEMDGVTESFPFELEDDPDEMAIVKKEAEKQLAPTPYLSKPPRWLKRTCGASFSFGGKLVQFCKPDVGRSRQNSLSQSQSSGSSDHGSNSLFRVLVSQVVTDRALLQTAVTVAQLSDDSADELATFCRVRSQAGALDLDRHLWRFIECHVHEDSRSAFVENLGYKPAASNSSQQEEEHAANDYSGENHASASAPVDVEDYDSSEEDEDEDAASEIDLSSDDGGLSLALMTGELSTAVALCLREGRLGEAAVLAVSSGSQSLYQRVQRHVLRNSDRALVRMAVRRDWDQLARQADLSQWRQTLVWLLTYCSAEELPELCRLLATRLESHGTAASDYPLAPCVCYVAAGAVDEFVECWTRSRPLLATKDYQQLAEMMVLLCKCIGPESRSMLSTKSGQLLVQYAGLLCSQGNLQLALHNLREFSVASNSTSGEGDRKAAELVHRICVRLRTNPPADTATPFQYKPIFGGNKPAPYGVPNRPCMPKHAHVPAKNSYQQSQPPLSFPNSQPFRHMSGGSSNNGGQMPPLSPSHVTQTHHSPYRSVAPIQPPQTQYPQPSLPPYAGQQPVIRPVLPPQQPMPHFMPATPTTAPGLTPPQAHSEPHVYHATSTTTDSWNDPPVLSDTYINDKVKQDTQPPQKFYNPTDFSSAMNSSIGGLGGLCGVSGVIPTGNLNSSIGSLPGHFSAAATLSQVSNGQSPGSQPLSDEDTTLLADTEKALLGLINLCRLKDSSRQTRVKMEDHERRITDWCRSRSGTLLSPEMRQLLSVAVTIALPPSLSGADNVRVALDRLALHMPAVSFSEAAGFLPGLKMLLQTAARILSVA